MYPVNLTVALEDELLRQEIVQTLAQLAIAWNEQDPRDWAGLLRHLGSVRPEIVLLAAGSADGDLASAIRQIRSRTPQTRVIAVHPEPDPLSILSAMRAGAAEFVHSPLSQTLGPALQRVGESPVSAASEEKKPGKLVAFLSAKGGCGATTLACHVATELKRKTNGDVMLADFDFTSGAVSFLMKVVSEYSILDAVKNLSRLDESLWKALISRSTSGLAVLPAPASIAHGGYPEENEFRQVLRFMRTQHDWTVIDLGRSLTRTARAVLEEVDELFLVSTLEVMALHGVKSIIKGISSENSRKLQLVLNRTPKMMDITLDELHQILGRPLYATLPNDYPSLYDSYAAGTLLPANSRLAEHFARFAGRLVGLEAPAKAKKRFALFG